MYRVLNKPLWPFIGLIWLILLGLWTIIYYLLTLIFPQLNLLSYEIILIFFIVIYLICGGTFSYWLWRQFVVVPPSAKWMYDWDSGPWLHWVEDPSQSMVINWITKDITSSEVSFGLDPAHMAIISREKGKIHRIFLSNLQPATKYYFQILNFAQDSQIHQFKTAPDSKSINAPISFIVIGDTQNGGGAGNSTWAYPKLLDRIETESFDLMMHTGDATDQGNDIKSWREFFDQSHRVCADHPLHIAVGNHDTGSNYLQDKSIKKYRDDGANFDYFLGYKYGRPASERFITSYQSRYYSFEYGCSLFLFVDTQNQQLAASWSSQWEYLEKILSTTTKSWKIVMIHWPLIELRMPNQANPIYHFRQIRYAQFLIPLFEKYHVDLVFTGHEHLFMHHEIKTTSSSHIIHQIITGGAGNEVRQNPPLAKDIVNLPGFHYYEDSSHYCKVVIDPSSNIAQIQAIRPDGSILYETKVKKS